MDQGYDMFTEELPAATGDTAGNEIRSPHAEIHGYKNLQYLPADSIDQTLLATSIADLPVLEIFSPDHLMVELDSGLLPISPVWLTSPTPLPEVTPERPPTFCGRENEECLKAHGEDLGIVHREMSAAEVAGMHEGPRRKTRAAKVHNEAEKKRRERINTKMKELRELLPNSSKLDMASTLDEAIKCVKSLQLQLHTLGMGWWACATPMVAPVFSHQAMQQQMGSMALRINGCVQSAPGMESSSLPLPQSNSLSGAPALQWSLQPQFPIPQLTPTESPCASTSSNPPASAISLALKSPCLDLQAKARD